MYIATESETQVLAREFAGQLQRGDIVALHGDLGAGKTTFVKGIVGVLSPENLVQSPTFIYLNIYEGRIPLYHFDLYRLENEKAFLQMGFFDYLAAENGICLIEWPERISSLLPTQTKHVILEHTKNGGRQVEL